MTTRVAPEPDDTRLERLRGRAATLFSQKRYDLAERDYREILATDPLDTRAKCMLAMCAARTGKVKEAYQLIELALAEQPNQWVSHYFRSVFAYERGWQREALAAAQESIRLDRSQSQSWAHLARVTQASRDYAASLHAAEQALQLDPLNVDCQILRGTALGLLGRRAEAKDVLNAALRLAPDEASTHAISGALLACEDTTAAIAHLRESLRINPESKWNKELLRTAQIMGGQEPIPREPLSEAQLKHSRNIVRLALVLLIVIALIIAVVAWRS